MAGLLREYLVSTRADFMADAACKGEDPEMFFVGKGEFKAARRALDICHRCPVKEPCLRYAVDNGIGVGIYGGTTPRQRRRMR